MVPKEKVSPELWVLVNVFTAQLSEVLGSVQLTAAVQAPASVSWVMSAGMPVMAGFSSSVTVMLNDVVVVLAASSVAVYVTVVVPTANVSPGSWVEVMVAPQLSDTVGAVQPTAAPQMPASLDWLISVGVPVMEGASLSVTVTVKEAVAVLPAASVAM